jgi:hypothetical protein
MARHRFFGDSAELLICLRENRLWNGHKYPVAIGQPIIWSVGADLTDNGGISQYDITSSVGDLVFPVPVPAKQPGHQ